MSRHINSVIHARTALLENGWHEDVRISVQGGVITAITVADRAQAGDSMVGALLPALPNLHSHTFQRAMAGMTEYASAAQDNFWSWRELMYRFMDQLTPEDIEAVAAFAFMEMLEAGFGAVAEFHYVHHQKGGVPYANVAELGERIAAAANETGIGLTLLPVLYSYGGAGERPLAGGQMRFGTTFDQYAHLLQASRELLKRGPADMRCGVAPHSLRATSPAQLARLGELTSNGPFHIHAAEQVKEVADVETWLGKRPIQWLLDHAAIDARWCLIHATHMTEQEIVGLARAGAVAGLCPLTESNLGDGIFTAKDYLAAGGTLGIGTDSNIRISVTGELSTLEYSQRLKHQARNVLAVDGMSTGRRIYAAATRGGAQALQRNCAAIAKGMLADLVALDTGSESLAALKGDQILDGWIFASREAAVTDTWAAGRHVVKDGRHIKREEIGRRYRLTLADLKGRI